MGEKVRVEFHHFTVKGYGAFPIDMLRYDTCWPTTEEDALTISETLRLMGRNSKIRLTGIHAPTNGRWESFGWKVVE